MEHEKKKKISVDKLMFLSISKYEKELIKYLT